MTDLPACVDLTPALPPVRRQGELDSCVASAISAALAVDLAFEPSRLFIHFHCPVPRRMRGGIEAVRAHGFCPEAEWPYDVGLAGTCPPDAAYAAAAPFQNCEARSLAQELDTLKGCLAAGRPFVCGLMLHYRFLGVDVRRSGVIPIPAPHEPLLGGHGIAVVGYDDGRASFRIRNSMGTTWGDRGYGWAPYAYLTNPVLAADFWSVCAY